MVGKNCVIEGTHIERYVSVCVKDVRANREIMICLTGPCARSLIDGVRDVVATATRM